MHLLKSLPKKFIALTSIALLCFFALGVYGWRETLNQAGVHASWLHAIELSVEMVHGSDAVVVDHQYDEHWTVGVGRWGIKAIFAVAIFQSAILIFSRQWRHLYFRQTKDHSVYVGLAAQSEVLASHDLEKGLRVAVLDADEQHSARGTLEGKGVFFQYGALGDKQLLAKARMATARRVVVATGNDEENVGVAEKIVEIIRGEGDFSGEAVEILVCMDSRDFCEVLMARWEPLRKPSKKYSVKLVRFRAVAVRELVNRMTREIAAIPQVRQRGPRVLLMASEMTDDVLAAAIVFMQISGDARPQFWVNSADQNGKAHFLRRYPAIELVADVHFINENLHTIANCEELAGLELDAAVICSEREIDALAIAEQLLRSGMFEVARIKVLLNKLQQLELVGDLRLEVLSLAKEGMESPELCDTDAEKEARKTHEAYLNGLSEESRKTKPAAKDWMFLAEEFKDSNRLAVLHRQIKRTIYSGFSGEDQGAVLEMLSVSEHQRWMAEKIINGWRFGVHRNDEKRIHPDIMPYDSLSDEIKSYDRTQVRVALGL